MAGPMTEQGRSLFSGIDAPDESELYKCVHCGFCLQACPTYIETGLETESPRGRIALMKAVNEGRIEMTDNVIRHWDLCIQCRACEPACPSGVPYGRLIEATMKQVEDKRKTGILPRVASNISLNVLVPDQQKLKFLAKGMRFYQRSGIQGALRKSHLLNVLSPRLAEIESSMPDIPATMFEARGQTVPAKGEKRARVALLSGCVMPLVNGPEMNAVVRVLTRNGCEVVIPKEQVCCGAIHTHMGDLEGARELAKRNIDAFFAAGVDAVVNASAGCGTRLKEYDHLLRDDPEYAEAAQRFSGMVKDIHEFLVDLPFDPPEAELDYRVTYQDSCHLSNSQGITRQPREILRSIRGIELVELSNADKCCGAGGTYIITQRDFSLRVLDVKMKAVRETGADVIATANPGCVLQLRLGATREGLPIRTCYVMELLDEAYSKETRAKEVVPVID